MRKQKKLMFSKISAMVSFIFCNYNSLYMWCSFFFYINVSSTNSEQRKLCVNCPLYIDIRLLWEQAISCNSA